MITFSRIAAVALSLAAPLPALAGPVETACNRSDRAAASRAMCGCIQAAADMTLDRSDQKRVAKFFNDQEAVQKVKLSDTDRDDAFWRRYSAFSDTAQAMCSAG